MGLRKLMKAGSAKRKAAPSLSKHQLVDDLKKLKRAAGESARSTMVVDTPETEISKKPVSSKKQDKELTQLSSQDKSALPDGFFDSKEKEHKVKGTPKELKHKQEAEWKKYQEELEAEEMQKTEHADQLKRELDDAKFQIHLYKKADKLADKFEEKAAKLRQKRKLEEAEVSKKIDKLINNQFSDNESDSESDEEADWRS